MKNQKIIPGILLIGCGVYFTLQQLGIAIFPEFFSWSTIVLLVGSSFLIGAYVSNDVEAILPGVLLTGIGLHFHLAPKMSGWPNDLEAMIILIALGMFLRYQKSKSDLLPTILLIALAIVVHFNTQLSAYISMSQTWVHSFWKFWPVTLVALGAFVLMKRKK